MNKFNNNNEENLYRNFLEMKVYGLMRSGNHAIIDGIQRLYPQKSTCFLNNIKYDHLDPYSSYAGKVITNINPSIEIESLRILPKHLLICSYEDYYFHYYRKNGIDNYESIKWIHDVFQNNVVNNSEKYVGKSLNKLEVLILRDAFNFFASRLKFHSQMSLETVLIVANNWKILAKKALELENQANSNKIVIKYNQWVRDDDYRKKLANLFLANQNHNNLTMYKIPNFGGGSSFSDLETRLTLKRIIFESSKLFRY